MVLPIPPGESLVLSIRQIPEGFELVTIENTGDGPLTINSVGIWFPALSMGYDFGPSRISKDHPFPGYPVTIAPGETVTYPINIGEITRGLTEKNGRITDFTFYTGTDHNTRHSSAAISVSACLRAPEPNPMARKTPPDGGVFQA
jgi:hypothetical protein